MTEEERAALLREIAETKASAAQVRKILDTIPTFASCNLPDGSNEFLNQRWHDYTGLSPQEARGRGWRVAIHPDDLQKVLDTFRALRASGEPREVEHRLRRHDGEYRWFLFRVEPLRDELGNIVRWYATNTDIENLKRTEEKLRQDEREIRRITDAIPQTIVIQRPDGTPIYANQAVLDYSGFTMEDVVASDFRARLFHPEDLERLREERQAALSRGLPFEIEQRARRKDGQYRWFLIRYNPFRDEQGRLVRWYATGTDIDDRKRTEDRVRNENMALREDIVRSSMFEEIVGSSAPLRRVLAQVEKVAPTVSTVLILGETGTGKELIARAIHSRSKRSGRAFIRVNCAAIPPPLVFSLHFFFEPYTLVDPVSPLRWVCKSTRALAAELAPPASSLQSRVGGPAPPRPALQSADPALDPGRRQSIPTGIPRSLSSTAASSSPGGRAPGPVGRHLEEGTGRPLLARRPPLAPVSLSLSSLFFLFFPWRGAARVSLPLLPLLSPLSLPPRALSPPIYSHNSIMPPNSSAMNEAPSPEPSSGVWDALNRPTAEPCSSMKWASSRQRHRLPCYEFSRTVNSNEWEGAKRFRLTYEFSRQQIGT